MSLLHLAGLLLSLCGRVCCWQMSWFTMERVKIEVLTAVRSYS